MIRNHANFNIVFPLCYVASLNEGHTEVYETVRALSTFFISSLSDSDTLTQKHSNQMFSPCLQVDRFFVSSSKKNQECVFKAPGALSFYSPKKFVNHCH